MIESFLSGINCIIDNKIIKPNVIPPAPVSPYITFVDPEVERICIENWSSDGIGLTYEDAASVKSLGLLFENNEIITSFKELQYFTGLMDLDDDDYSGVFFRNTALKEIIIPNGVETLGWCCFEGCTALTSIVVPDSVILIEKAAFKDTPFMNNMPQGVNYINRVLFKYIGEMPAETSIIVREGTISIAAEAFFYCSNLISITLPNTLQRIGYEAFNRCGGLTAIEIPESVTIIEEFAFRSCTGLTSVTVPNSVTKILNSGFSRCSNLVDITLGNSINFIGDFTFDGNAKLKSITVNAVIPPTLEDEHVFRSCSGLTNIYVPAESVESYKVAPYWSAKAGIIKAQISPTTPITFADPVVKQICVENWGSDGEITYEQAAAVTDLNGAFDYWSNNPPTEQITSFDELQYFTGLTILGESPEGNGQFSGAEQLTSIILPPNLITIGYFTFEDCSGLTSIIIPNSVTSIGSRAFSDCSGLTSITIPNSITSISNDLFKGCTGLTEITIPNSVTSIGNNAFWNCIGLTSVTIPDSVTSIGNGAFQSCTGLTSITIPNSITSIGSSAFAGCSGLTSITIPNSITTIEPSTFSNCSGLTSITIPNSVTSIGDYAFYNCTGLTSVIVESLTPPIGGNGIFSGNDNLINIYVPAESVDTYKTAPYWSDYASIIKAQISPTTPITFADPVVKALCVANWGSNGEITHEQVASVTDLGTVFTGNTNITSFNELQYFTGLTTLKNNAFTRCTNLASVTLPSSIRTLENGIMAQLSEESYGCFFNSGLTSITIPAPVTSIGDIAFAYCPNITSLTIPTTVSNIGNAAFFSSGLTTITANSETPCTIQNNTFANCANLTNIYVPAGSVDTYKATSGWSDYADVISAIV